MKTYSISKKPKDGQRIAVMVNDDTFPYIIMGECMQNPDDGVKMFCNDVGDLCEWRRLNGARWCYEEDLVKEFK